MVLVTEVEESGLPKPGAAAQTLRVQYADTYLKKDDADSRADARARTQSALRDGEKRIFTGKKMLHAALLAPTQRRQKGNSCIVNIGNSTGRSTSEN